MIAAWMVYCLAVGLAFCIAGWAAERALYLARRPTRWAWGAGLSLTLLLPVAALLRPQAFGSITVPLAPARAPTLNAPTPAHAISVADAQQPATGLSWADVDGLLGWGWGAASTGVLLALAMAAVRLAVLRRRWHAVEVDGRSVLVAENIGPAVTGLWPSRVVIPAWALALTERQRRLMLAHEEEHVRSRDPWLLLVGTAAVTAAPWNPALWWLLRRLRHAVEMDCDARVLRAGHNPFAYGELLLRVGQHRAHLPFAVAMSEPRSLLELRIRRLSARLPRWRWLGASAALVGATAAIVAACEAPRPVSPKEAAPVDFVGAPAAIAISARASAESLIAEAMVPWIRENLRRYYPDLLGQHDGPPVDVWLGHDSRLEVLRAARTPGTAHPIGSEQILSVFNRFRPGNDAWGVVDRWALKGLVRDNVRVIWVHLGNATPQTNESPGGTDHPETFVYWTEDSDTIRVPAERRADDQPELLSGPELPSPKLLHYAGIHGRVVVRAVIDSNGRAEPATVQVIKSLHPAADQVARIFMLGARFRPARVRGRAVRIPTELTVDFLRDVAPAPSQHPASGDEPPFPDAEYLLRVARRYHPEVFTHPAPQTAVGLIFNAERRLLAHAAGVREAQDDGCLAVVQRLLPTYANRRWSSSGCADGGDPLGRIVVYWMALR